VAHTNNSIHFDAIVIGVGSMGSAACWFLAKRGQKVLGLEQFNTPHENGSHAGQSRIIRKAYFEHPDYVPLLERAYNNWRAFELESGSSLYHRTGIVYLGKNENENISGIRNSARLYDVPLENLSHEECKKRFPSFNVPGDFDVIFEPDAGFVTPERTIESYVGESRKNGAVIKTNTPVLNWRQDINGIRVITEAQEYTCEKLVVTAGAWTSGLIPELKSQLQVTRQVLAWVTPPDSGPFTLESFPCWFIEDPSVGTFYGFPILPQSKFGGPSGLKLAHHHPGMTCSPEDIHGDVPMPEKEKLQDFLRTYLPSAGDHITHVKNCLYTYSPDSDFIIDHLPGYANRVVVASGFSGHGFKFVPVVGEILADLAMKGRTDLPIDFLRLKRLRGFHG
jgi:sarcosine oxidase